MQPFPEDWSIAGPSAEMGDQHCGVSSSRRAEARNNALILKDTLIRSTHGH
jgi:hypothetical protein